MNLTRIATALLLALGLAAPAAAQGFGPTERSVVAGWKVPAPTSMS